MTDNHEHTPTTDLVSSVYVQYMTRHGDTSMKRIDDGFDRWLATVEAAAEQRGAIKALRDAADYLAENKQVVIDGDEYTACNSCTVIQYEYLTYRADQMEGDDE